MMWPSKREGECMRSIRAKWGIRLDGRQNSTGGDGSRKRKL